MRAPIAFCDLLEGHLGNPDQPLRGKRVVVTRAPEQAHTLVEELEDLGAEILLMPTVSFSDPVDMESLDAALRLVGQFDWVLFTSANAVQFVSKRCRALGLDGGKLQAPRPMVAAVGPATASAAEEAGFRVDFVAKQARGVALADELWGSINGRKILLPRSDRGDKELPAALLEAGGQVTEVVAYRIMAAPPPEPEVRRLVGSGEVDAVTFASPSAFRQFSDILGKEVVVRIAQRAVFAAIGPTTAEAIRSQGFPVEIQAADPSPIGLAAAIANYFARIPSGVKKS